MKVSFERNDDVKLTRADGGGHDFGRAGREYEEELSEAGGGAGEALHDRAGRVDRAAGAGVFFVFTGEEAGFARGVSAGDWRDSIPLSYHA